MSARPRVVVVGAGLGGAFVAHGLADTHNVTVIELDAPVDEWQRRIVDVGEPAQLDPHVGAGLGGTTALWHNGLIEIDADTFRFKWPFPKDELDPYYAEAFHYLSGVQRDTAESAAGTLRARHTQAGLRADRMPYLFVPVQRRNSWHTLGLDGRVSLVLGEVMGFTASGSRVRSVEVRNASGTQSIDADIVILSAGGLGTPPLLQGLSRHTPFPGAQCVGCFYEDHPMAYVGEVTLRQPLYRFWNFPVPGANANLRMPLVVIHDGLQVSFQLRPAALYRQSHRQGVQSLITQLRNRPYNLANYFRLLGNLDDLFDILSFRFGIRVPTKNYSVLLVAEQPALADCDVWGEDAGPSGAAGIFRRWTLSPGYVATLAGALKQFIAEQGDLVAKVRFFPDWHRTLASAAHHSGTARMSVTPAGGACDSNARVHGLENVYVADGSLIPASGIANTGLTIAALALRLAAHLRRI